MPRARVVAAAAVATVCAAAAAACTLSDVYSSKYGEEAGASSGEASARTDASTDANVTPPDDATSADDAPTSDSAVPYFDAGDANSCQSAEAGPFGDYCLGVPEILMPFDDATVGLTFTVQVQAPCCIRDFQIYMQGAKVIPLVAGYAYEGTLTVKEAGSYALNANGWNKTSTPHESPHVGFNVVAGH